MIDQCSIFHIPLNVALEWVCIYKENTSDNLFSLVSYMYDKINFVC